MKFQYSLEIHFRMAKTTEQFSGVSTYWNTELPRDGLSAVDYNKLIQSMAVETIRETSEKLPKELPTKKTSKHSYQFTVSIELSYSRITDENRTDMYEKFQEQYTVPSAALSSINFNRLIEAAGSQIVAELAQQVEDNYKQVKPSN